MDTTSIFIMGFGIGMILGVLSLSAYKHGLILTAKTTNREKIGNTWLWVFTDETLAERFKI